MNVYGWGKPLGYDTPERVEPHHAIVSVRFGAHRTACRGSWSTDGVTDQWEFIFGVFLLTPAMDKLTDAQVDMLIGPGSSVCEGCKAILRPSAQTAEAF